VSLIGLLGHLEHLFLHKVSTFHISLDSTTFLYSNSKYKQIKSSHFFALLLSFLKRPPIREDLKVLIYQSQEADNTFITSDGTSPYDSTR
jgi:hypothetical protein